MFKHRAKAKVGLLFIWATTVGNLTISFFLSSRDHMLLKLKNIIITPHLSIKTDKATYMITEEPAENILAALNGLPIPSEVLPSWCAKGYHSSLFILLFPLISSEVFYSYVFLVKRNLFQVGTESSGWVSHVIKKQLLHFNFLAKWRNTLLFTSNHR